jgi:GT2 family glycosyltransferase
MKQSDIELSIILLNYNTSQLTIECLDSLVKAKESHDTWEVLVIDNNSEFQDVANLKAYIQKNSKAKELVKLTENDKNVGFAAGNNIGIKKARGNFILLLNSDTEVPQLTIQTVLSEIKKNPSVGVATCKLLLPSGKMDPACHRGFPTPWAAVTYFSGLEKLFPTSPFFSQYHLGSKNTDTNHEIDVPSGAFFLVKKEVIEQVGLLDESYFMYGEDIDWSYRIKQAGWKILFIPSVTILHKKKQSGRASSNTEIRKKTTISFYETMQLFYKKHYRTVYPTVITASILWLLDFRIELVKRFNK